MNTKPVLVSSTPGGGTIHTYPITGGKRTFERYLGCYLGSCKFCNDVEEAREFVKRPIQNHIAKKWIKQELEMRKS